MIATKESFEPSTLRSYATEEGHSSEQLPNSKRVYLPGQIHADVRVPVREIELTPTKSYSGAAEANEPVRVYDCSGPWGDPDFTGTVAEGLPALRAAWIRARGDVEEYDGREVKPQDNGYLSDKHAEYASQAEKNRLIEFPGLTANRHRSLRAKAGKIVTQLAYARAGIITPEMEFIAIRENMRAGQASRLSLSSEPRVSDLSGDIVRNDLNKQHAGSGSTIHDSRFNDSPFMQGSCSGSSH